MSRSLDPSAADALISLGDVTLTRPDCRLGDRLHCRLPCVRTCASALFGTHDRPRIFRDCGNLTLRVRSNLRTGPSRPNSCCAAPKRRRGVSTCRSGREMPRAPRLSALAYASERRANCSLQDARLRYSAGVSPDQRLNALLKFEASENPSRTATSSTLKPVLPSNSLASRLRTSSKTS